MKDQIITPSEKATEIMLNSMQSMKEQGFHTKTIWSVEAFKQIAMKINSTKGKEKDYWIDVMKSKKEMENKGFYNRY